MDDHLEVPYAKATVKDAPKVDVDAGGFLSVDEEHRLYEHYGIPWDEGQGWQQVVNQPDQGGQGSAGSRSVSLPYGNTSASGVVGNGKESPGIGSVRSDSSEDGAVMTRSEQERAGTTSPAAGQARLRLYVVPRVVRVSERGSGSSLVNDLE